jgi:signal transduction histidine kinase
VVQQSGVRVRIDTQDAPLFVSGDPMRLGQIVANLVNNAAKYTPAGGEATITLRRAEPHAEVSVRDTGIGIAAQDLDRIFDTFVRISQPGVEPQWGLGLGLPLARRLAVMHRGTLEASSNGVGNGSEFTLKLPLIRPA